MAYDLELADRIRRLIHTESGLTEQKMFGGLAFLINGNMMIAASGQGGLLVRLDPAESEDLVTGPDVQLMEMRGQRMPGWLRVSSDAVATDKELSRWISAALRYTRTLLPKR